MKRIFFTILPCFVVGSTAVRINCGGLAFPDGSLADSQVYHNRTKSTVKSYFNKKAGTQKSIFSTHSWTPNNAMLSYSLPVESESYYNLTMYFAENREINFATGRRVFDVAVNGQVVEANVDPWKKVGSFSPYAIKVPRVSPEGNEILVDIIPRKGRAMISAIEYDDDEVPKDDEHDSSEPEIKVPNFEQIETKFKRVKYDYPLKVFEAAGTVMTSKEGKQYLVVFGGYQKFPNVTKRVYRREFGVENTKWERLSDLPQKVTHLAQWVAGNVFCGVGGYEGDYPGVSGKKGFCYDLDTDKYTPLRDLPADRAGGGLVMIENKGKKLLLYAGGVDRTTNSLKHHVDHGTTWTLEYETPGANWTRVGQDMPHPRNHMAAIESCGRYYFVGSQKGINEHTGNSRVVSEFLPDKMRWSKDPPPPLPFPLGHVSASVMEYKCGIMVIGGISNNRTMMNSVLYFNSTENQWSQIGNYTHKVATPVCGIVGDEIMCATGGEYLKRNDVFMGKIEKDLES